jgi:hypothetical protein
MGSAGKEYKFCGFISGKTRMNRGDAALQIRTLFQAVEAVQKI